jgi:hypothetical protein
MTDITAFPIHTVVEVDATQAEMQAGTEAGVRRMSPKNVADAITVSTDRLDIEFVWRADMSKWRCVAVA